MTELTKEHRPVVEGNEPVHHSPNGRYVIYMTNACYRLEKDKIAIGEYAEFRTAFEAYHAAAIQDIDFSHTPASPNIPGTITNVEIKELIMQRGLTLTNVIDVVCDLNGFVGVGFLSFGDQIGTYIKAKAAQGLSAEAWLNS